jgi:hypothetical protein
MSLSNNDPLQHAGITQQGTPPPLLQFQPAETSSHNARPTLWIAGLTLALIGIVGLGGLLLWFMGMRRAGEIRVAARAASITAPATPAQSALAAVIPADTETNTVPALASTVPPASLETKLQGICFNTSAPSAIVNGRTVFHGDPVGEWRVLAITRESVILGSAMATNVLSLSE